jgi:hypothetical protein
VCEGVELVLLGKTWHRIPESSSVCEGVELVLLGKTWHRILQLELLDPSRVQAATSTHPNRSRFIEMNGSKKPSRSPADKIQEIVEKVLERKSQEPSKPG